MERAEQLCRALICGRYFPDTSVWRKVPAWNLIHLELRGKIEFLTSRLNSRRPLSTDQARIAESREALAWVKQQILESGRDISIIGRQCLPKGDRG